MRAFQLLHSRIRHSLSLSWTDLCNSAKLKEPLNVKLVGFVSGYCCRFECCIMRKSMAHAYWKKWKTGEKISARGISSTDCGISWCQKLHAFLSACDTRRNHIIWIKCRVVPWSNTLFMSHSWGGIKFVPQEYQIQFTWSCVLGPSGSFGNTLSKVWAAAGSQGPCLLLLQDSLQIWQ